jgi:hypothetical protein
MLEYDCAFEGGREKRREEKRREMPTDKQAKRNVDRKGCIGVC